MYLSMLKIFIDVVTPVFVLVLVGYLGGPRLQLDTRTLSRTAYYILVPCFVFNIISKLDIDILVAGQMILYAALTHVLVAVAAFIIAKVLDRSKEMTVAFVIIATFGNVGNLGLSLIDFRLGQAAQVSATIYFITIMVVAFIICVGVASWSRGNGVYAVLSVFKTPALIAIVPAMFFYSTDFEVPLFLSRITQLLGRAMIPMMLVTLGVQLSDVNKLTFSVDVITASGVRLIGAPIIAFGMTSLFFLSDIQIRSGILQAGMPVAVMASIIAIEYNIAPKFVTTTVLFSTICSLITLTALLYLV